MKHLQKTFVVLFVIAIAVLAQSCASQRDAASCGCDLNSNYKMPNHRR